jgi:hypothetical protein
MSSEQIYISFKTSKALYETPCVFRIRWKSEKSLESPYLENEVFHFKAGGNAQ